jgi:long-subunit fatty acid transport protein
MKRNLLLIIGVLAYAYSFAQGEIDAFRFSGTDLTGTARGQAMGGAFGALGGDVTGIFVNPAGIGVYRSSEISATLSLNSTNIKTQGKEAVNNNGSSKFNFDNISYVGYYPVGGNSLQSVNFGFSYNRKKNFNRNYSASGKNMTASLTDYIACKTNGVYYNDMNPTAENDYDPFNGNAPWLSILGWHGRLINDVPNNEYRSLLDSLETVDTQMNVSEKGRIDSYDFTIGTNFSNSLYLGMTLSLTDIYYRMESWHSENFAQGDGFILDNYLQTEGTGFQVNLGAIWLPADFLRLGIAYHSPEWYVLKDFYQGRIEANLREKFTYSTPDNANFDYRFHSPHSWVFSAAGILGTKAIISMDYEIKDYRAMELNDLYSSASNSFNPQNQEIDVDFKIASTLRAGLEYRFTPQFSGRLGYALMQHPYKAKIKNREIEVITAGTIPHYTIEGNIMHLAAGFGYRFTPQFYIDFAFVYRTQKDDLYYYSPVWNKENKGDILVDSEPVAFTNTSGKGLLTLGYKF